MSNPSPPKQPRAVWSPDVEVITQRIREQLKCLRMDDLASYVHTKHTGIIGEEIGWLELTEMNMRHYLQYLWSTWGDVAHTIFRRHVGLVDVFSVLFFATGASLVLAGIFTWCFFATSPPLVWLFGRLTKGTTGGLGLVNAANPNIFRNLTEKQACFAKEKLSAQPDPSGHNPRVFDLDIAKFLLQISALMYEREHEGTQETAKKIQNHLFNNPMDVLDLSQMTSRISSSAPGHLMKTIVGGERNLLSVFSTNDEHRHHEDAMHTWAETYGVCYEPVSELASLSQAYCSVFWEKTGSWVVVAFKGTDPRSFEEWSTDFTARFEDTSRDIPGFLHVHRGFKERIFPTSGLGDQRRPIDTILAATRTVCDELVKVNPPGTKINVWFTGHSLGTAISTLSYAKALVQQELLGENACLRDAYLFATPITADIKSRNTFNRALYGDPKVPRAMWRVTNRNDFVATGLPALGDDNPDIDLGPNNLFGFAHLGVEIFMRSRPQPCQVKNAEGHRIHIASSFTRAELIEERKKAVQAGKTVAKIYLWMQYLPILGRLAAHATTNYFDQLDQIALGGCVEKR